MKKNLIAVLALGLALSTGAAFANDHGNGNNGNNGQGQGQTGAGGIVAGGYAAVAGGYNLTTYAGHIDGTSSADAAGGGMASSGVTGNGWSIQGNAGAVGTTSYATGTLAADSAHTTTGGTSYALNASAGKTSGDGVGAANGAAGGDYAASAHGSFSTDYTGVAGNAWLAGVVAGGYAYGQYGYGQ